MLNAEKIRPGHFPHRYSLALRTCPYPKTEMRKYPIPYPSRPLHILQHPAAPVFSQSLVLGLSPASQEHVSSLLPHGSSSLWTLAFNKLSTQTPRRQEETPTPGKGQSVWLELRTGGRISSRTVARLGFRGGASLHCPLSLEAPEGCGAGQGEAGPWASLQPSPSPLAAWGRPWGRDGQRGGVSVSFWLHRL